MKPTISVCTIVKNERNRVSVFFDSLIDFADEIVIVDTGSTDDTLKVIEDYIFTHKDAPIRLIKYTVTGGFHYGIAKNFSIENAKSEYIIVLDADERITDTFKEKIHNFLIKEQPLVANVVRQDELLPHLIDYPERIIKKDSNIRYGVDNLAKVHEQLVYSVPVKCFNEKISHEQRWNHYVARPQRIFFQLELQVDRIPKTKSFFGHILRGVWYFGYRFKKIYFKRKLYKDGRLGFKYAFMRSLDAFLIQLFVGLKPSEEMRYWDGDVSEK